MPVVPAKEKMTKFKPERTTSNSFASAIIPSGAISRMAIYLRELQQLQRSGIDTINSSQLGERLGFTDSQVRRDLGAIGAVGRRGVGYSTSQLCQTIRSAIGTDRDWNIALVGMGNLGQALAGYRGFETQGFRLVAAIDLDQAKVGKKVGKLTIKSIDQFDSVVARTPIQLAILAVPAEVAPDVAERLAKSGVLGILNFAPTNVRSPKTCIPVIDVDMAIELQRLAFAVVNQEASR